MPKTSTIGASVARNEGAAKVTGAARYIDDYRFPGMLYGATIRAEIPCGDIVAVRYLFDRAGFVTVDYRDIPGHNIVAAIADDQPMLAERCVRHVGEPLLLLAHVDRERLAEAVRGVQVQYRPGVPVLDAQRSPRTFKALSIEQGDVERGLAEADLIVEGEYSVGHQEHLYIETNGMIAVPHEDGGVTVYGSMQCPYYVHRALRVMLALPAHKIRVVQVETGGGFGGKEDFPSMLAGHASLLALKAKRPVKLVYDRAEDMLATTKRHPGVIRHRTGVTRDGRLTALDVDVLLDGGAYTTLSPVVLSRALLHAAGAYRWDHARIRGRVVMTNTPPNGAFRGFGAPQTQFAMEVHIDRIAEQLGLDPVVIRERNLLRAGDTMPTGQRMREDCSAAAVLAKAVEQSDYCRKRRELAGTNRGIGLALFLHGAGFTGAGEVKLASRASIELTPRAASSSAAWPRARGGVRVLASSAEIGQGSRTVHAQIVAETLGLPIEAVEVAMPDTAVVPDSGPTVASRTSMVVGGLLERCASEIKARLRGLTPAEYVKKHGALTVTREYRQPDDITWDEDAYQGDAYGTFAWGCDVAEVTFDRDTYEIRPTRITAVQEIGRVLNPTLARCQVEGGTLQAVGYALTEEVVMRDGRMANAQMTNYQVPTTVDAPEIDVVLLEAPYRHGPFGAKGLGELPFDGPAPAIVNAIRHLGIDVRSLPATAEKVLEAIEKGAGCRVPGA
ncbi:MAG: xanthine dehydrogenase family protein molybdopterin-binding subunit [Bacteroidales bacterium]